MSKKARILIPCVIVVVALVVFATHTEALRSFVDALATASLPFAAAAFCILVTRYLMYAWAFKAGFRAVGADIPYPKLVEIIFSITFINDTAPTAGMAGSVYMGTWAHFQGASVGGSVGLIVLDKITFFGSFAVLQTVGLVVLAAFGQLSVVLVLGCMVIYALALVFCGALYISHRRPSLLGRLLHGAVKVQNWFLARLHKEPVADWADRTARSIQEAADAVIAHPRWVARMFARMLALFCCEAASFACVALGFGYFDPAALVATYVAGFVMSMLVVQTVGVVETVLVVMLTSFGADFGVATAIALVYRGMQFWLPFAAGGFCLQRTSRDFERSERKLDVAFDAGVDDEGRTR